MCDSYNYNNTGNGTLATLTFTAPDEEGTYFIGVVTRPADTLDSDGNNVAFAYSNSEIIVSACNHVAGNVETQPATCTEAGYTRVYCSICGNVIDETIYPAKGHQPGDWEIVTPATTTTSGLKVKRCTACGITLQEKTIFPIGSAVISVGETTVYANEPFTLPVTIENNPGIWDVHVYLTYPDTVTVTGITGSEDVLGDIEVGALNLVPSTNAVARQAFQVAGESMDGVKTVSINMNNYDNEDTYENGKLFDAAFAGLPVGSYRIYLVMRPDECFNWDEIDVPMNLDDVVINVIERPTCEHANTTTVTVPATCTEAGYTRVTCDDCGTIISNTVLPAPGHDYVETGRVDATCEVAGTITETCSRCQDVRTTPIPAPGHDWSEWVNISATERQRTCSRCGQTQTEPIPVTPTIAVAGKTVNAGETFTVDVTVAGNPGVYSMNVLVYFDEALTLNSVANGNVFSASEFEASSNLNRLPSDSANATEAFAAANVDPSGCRFASLFFMCDAFADNDSDGTLATLTFTAPAEDGTYFVGVVTRPADTTNNDGDNVTFAYSNSEIIVNSLPTVKVGDVNGDGKVTTKDLTLLKRYVQGGGATLDDIVFLNSDINNDGKVNTKDYTLLKKYFQGNNMTYADLVDIHDSNA